MEGTYDIRYYVDREKRYLGAEILVASGLTLVACASELDACCLRLETLGQ